MRVLILIDDGFEDLEFYYPYLRFLEEGFEVDVSAPKKGIKTGKHGLTFRVEKEVKDIEPGNYDAVFIPGGHAPDRLRRYEEVLNVVRKVHERGGIVGSICHGPHVLISAGIVRGVKLTSFFSIKDDLINAGAEWVDESVVADGNIVTSRVPSDLPKLMPVLIDTLKGRKRE